MRKRRVKSIQNELLFKSREAALTAVQIFNNPQVKFKSELFIVTICIAWTYLLQAYFRKKGVEYRYFEKGAKRRAFDKTKGGAFKHWELERCLNDANSPIDKNAAQNLRFLIGLRHEIEHQMTTRIDNSLSAKFQATCLNFNHYIKKLFGSQYGIEKHLSFSLQFSSISQEQEDTLSKQVDLPDHIKSFVSGFEADLSQEDYNHPSYAYRVLFVRKTANHPSQADEVIEFVKAGTELAKNVNTKYMMIKEIERPKYRPIEVIRMIKPDYPRFGMHQHTLLWKEMDAKNESKGLGANVAGTWYWYETWINKVKKHCEENKARYV